MTNDPVIIAGGGLGGLAQTKAVDLWYLVPTGIGINRQITRDGKILEDSGPHIDAMLGTRDWRTRLVKTAPGSIDLFGATEPQNTKAPLNEIVAFVIERLAGIFKGGVVQYGLPLGTQGRAMYTLVFACANPTPKASQLALRLAGAVLKS